MRLPNWQRREIKWLLQETEIGNKMIAYWYGVEDNYVVQQRKSDITPLQPDLKKLEKMRGDLNEDPPMDKLDLKTRRKIKMYYYYNSDYSAVQFPSTSYKSIRRWKDEEVEPAETPSEASGLDEAIKKAKKRSRR